MAHLTCHTAHICWLWPGPDSAGCSASFATCPFSVRGALASLPAGENSCLMMFKEAEYFPSRVRLWGRKQLSVSCLFCCPCCTSCSSLLLCGLRSLWGEEIQSFACACWWNHCLAGALCWEVYQGVSLCLLVLPWGLLSFSSTPKLLAPLPLSPHVSSCWSTQNAPMPRLAWGGPAGLFSLPERLWSWIFQFLGDTSSHYYCLKFKRHCWLSPSCLLQRPTV